MVIGVNLVLILKNGVKHVQRGGGHVATPSLYMLNTIF